MLFNTDDAADKNVLILALVSLKPDHLLQLTYLPFSAKRLPIHAGSRVLVIYLAIVSVLLRINLDSQTII